MKKEKTSCKEMILAVLFFPLLLLFLLGLLLSTPYDYYKYKKSHYYKDTKEKYSWHCASSPYIKLYDLIKNENLPIDYYRCEDVPIVGYGFFVYKDILILNDCVPCYDEENNLWLVEVEDEYVDIKEDVQNTIDRCNELLENRVCKKAVVLIDKELWEEHPDVQYEGIEFLPVNDDMDVEAIKTLIAQ